MHFDVVLVCPEVLPSLQTTHLCVKQALVAFGKLYPQSIGAQVPDMLYSQISLSLRILMCHWRRCARQPATWTTCMKAYKGAMSLQAIAETLPKIELSDDDDESDFGIADATGALPPTRATSAPPTRAASVGAPAQPTGAAPTRAASVGAQPTGAPTRAASAGALAQPGATSAASGHAQATSATSAASAIAQPTGATSAHAQPTSAASAIAQPTGATSAASAIAQPTGAASAIAQPTGAQPTGGARAGALPLVPLGPQGAIPPSLDDLTGAVPFGPTGAFPFFTSAPSSSASTPELALVPAEGHVDWMGVQQNAPTPFLWKVCINLL